MAKSGSSKKALSLQPETVSIAVPRLSIEGSYSQKRMELTLSSEEAQTLRSICDGMIHSGTFKGNKNPSAQDVIRWMLRRVSEAKSQ